MLQFFILLVAAFFWIRWWRLYREINQDRRLKEDKKELLKQQLVALIVYLPTHLIALTLPTLGLISGALSIIAGLLLLYLGGSAIKNRLAPAFNWNPTLKQTTIEGNAAIFAGAIFIGVAAFAFVTGAPLLL